MNLLINNQKHLSSAIYVLSTENAALLDVGWGMAQAS